MVRLVPPKSQRPGRVPPPAPSYVPPHHYIHINYSVNQPGGLGGMEIQLFLSIINMILEQTQPYVFSLLFLSNTIIFLCIIAVVDPECNTTVYVIYTVYKFI